MFQLIRKLEKERNELYAQYELSNRKNAEILDRVSVIDEKLAAYWYEGVDIDDN